MTPPDRTLLTDAELDDVLAALADAEPVDDAGLATARARVLGAVATPAPTRSSSDVVELPPVTSVRAPRRRRVFVALVAAAVLVLVAGLATAVVQAQRPHGTGPAVDLGDITCLVDPASPSPAATDRAKELIGHRLTQLGATAVRVTADDGRVGFSADGVDPVVLRGACTSTRPALRPLVVAPVALTGRTGALAPAGVTLPTSDTAYAALPAADRQRVDAAVLHTDCAGDADTDPDRSVILCDSTTAPTVAYLLGPALLTGEDFGTATAQAPRDEQEGWTVQIEVRGSGSRTLADYTGAHAAPPPESCKTANCAAQTAAPPSSYLGIVASDTVVSAPSIDAPVTGSIQISGAFDRAGATAIADALDEGGLDLVAT